jgi:hypothetical protein
MLTDRDTPNSSTRTRARARNRRLATSYEPKACLVDAPGGGGVRTNEGLDGPN